MWCEPCPALLGTEDTSTFANEASFLAGGRRTLYGNVQSKTKTATEAKEVQYYDRRAQDLPPLNVGDTVRIQSFHGRVGEQGTVTE